MSMVLAMLPGLMCDARLFAHQIKDLSRDHVVIVCPVTQERRIEAIASALLRNLPSRFALLGAGLGGMVAMDILRQAPDRVDRAFLMATNPLPETPDIAATREPLIVRAQAGFLEDVLSEAGASQHLALGPQRMDALSELRRMGLDLGAEIFVRQSRALQRRRDQQGTLRRYKGPTCILCGAEDTLTPVKRHAFMADLMPDGRLEVVEGAGHLPSLEQPKTVTSIIRDWLENPMVLR